MPRARRCHRAAATVCGDMIGKISWHPWSRKKYAPGAENRSMIAKRTPRAVAAPLTVPERVRLICVASGTEWVKTVVTGAYPSDIGRTWGATPFRRQERATDAQV